jgi:hypothetical protein
MTAVIKEGKDILYEAAQRANLFIESYDMEQKLRRFIAEYKHIEEEIKRPKT